MIWRGYQIRYGITFDLCVRELRTSKKSPERMPTDWPASITSEEKERIFRGSLLSAICHLPSAIPERTRKKKLNFSREVSGSFFFFFFFSLPSVDARPFAIINCEHSRTDEMADGRWQMADGRWCQMVENLTTGPFSPFFFRFASPFSTFHLSLFSFLFFLREGGNSEISSFLDLSLSLFCWCVVLVLVSVLVCVLVC